MAALRRAENAPGAANLQVAHRDAKPRPQRAILANGVDPLASRADRHELTREEKVGIGFVLGAPDSPTQLIKVGQSEAIGAIDDDGIGIRNIEAALDDRRANQ